MWRLMTIACAVLGGCVLDPAVQVKPNETVVLQDGANGDVTCQQGTLSLPITASINGKIEAHYCVIEIDGTVNGSISTTGGILHVFDVGDVNGELEVHDAYELVVSSSQFNGGATVDGTRSVTIVNSGFNGDVSISGADSCDVSNNRANGSYVAAGCL